MGRRNECTSRSIETCKDDGHIDVILETGKFDINGGDNGGQTPLHYAIQGINPTINARHLIEEKGADPNIANANGVTPLYLVVFYPKIVNLSLIELVLRHKQVDIDASIKDGSTALHYAIDQNNVNVVRVLLEKGADPNKRNNGGRTPLRFAVEAALSFTGETQILHLLFANENVNINERDESGSTPLHYAFMKSNVTIARCLIESGANPNIADVNGFTPLFAAVTFAKDVNIVELLLNHKDVDVNCLSNKGENSLYYAKKNLHGLGERIANRLKEKGAVDTEVKMLKKYVQSNGTGEAEQIDSSNDSQIKTERDEVDCIASKALHDAIIKSDVERVEILIVTGLDFTKPKWGEKGINALHLASKCAKTTELIDIILENGQFHINGGDKDGQTPLHYAIRGDNPAINARHLIEEKGADPNITDKNGVTPLQLAAAETKTMDLIDLFLNNEVVDVNHRDNQGSNALVHALLNEHGLRDSTISRLRQRGAKEFQQ
jgi:ankyrin repeat protein